MFDADEATDLMSSLDGIVYTVSRKGWARYSMRAVRDACGWSRLGRAVVEDEIPTRLCKAGLWWYPAPLPNSQNAKILLMIEGSLEHQVFMLRSVSLDKAEEVLAQVRAGQLAKVNRETRSGFPLRRKARASATTPVSPEPKEWVFPVRDEGE
jgi:hypothetical protein